MSKSIPFDIPASSTPQKGVIEISDPVPTLNGTTIGFTQADPKITISGATPIPVPTPVPVPSPDVQDIKFVMQDLTKGDYARPGAGANNFFSGNGIQTPFPFDYLDDDTRFDWRSVQTAAGQYSFGSLDAAINRMISKGGKVTLRIVTFNPDRNCCPSFIPMLAGNQPDFNSSTYINGFSQFIKDLADHLKKTDSVKAGVKLIQGVYKFDISGIGKWGEMHFDGINSGIQTLATAKPIIDAHTSSFTDTWLGITISALTNNSKLGKELALYLLNAKNNLGPVYIRCDHFGWINTFNWDLQSQNLYDPSMLQLIKDRPKFSPVCGELMNTLSGVGSPVYSDLARQVTVLGASQFSNNNYARLPASGATASVIAGSDASIIAASKAAGARVSMNKAAISGNKLTIDWNVANAPVYEGWQLWIVTDQGSFQSSMQTIKGFVGAKQSTDTLPAGAKTISIILKDPDGYRAPYPLLNTGRQTDGSYKIV